jgi:hypothetical protein
MAVPLGGLTINVGWDHARDERARGEALAYGDYERRRSIRPR